MSVTTSSIGGPSHRRITIVGAGIAGLTLACLLQKQNIPFSIYEARNANTIGHSYAITLFRRPWKNIVNRLSKKHPDFRQDTAADRLMGGVGKVADQSPASSVTFQAVDRDVRQWLIQRLQEQGVEIKWDHKLSSISNAGQGQGASLSFEQQQSIQADIIIDAGGLRSPAFDHQVASAPQPRLLPYATYYGSRRISANEFSQNFAHYFRSGNAIELIPETPTTPLIQIKKVHIAGKSNADSTVELRWVYSRPAKDGSDPLYRPERTPDEAKSIPDEFYEEILDVIERDFSKKQRSMLKSFFTLSDLHNDRILNWHLRLRLPPLSHFTDNSNDGSFQVIAIGDAAHGLPIVGSKGAGVAAEDASNLARWLQKLVSGDSKSEDDLNYYKRPDIYRTWFKEAIRAVQRLRNCHGQPRLSTAELQETIGFWVEGIDGVESDSGGESSELETEEALQRKGRL